MNAVFSQSGADPVVLLAEEVFAETGEKMIVANELGGIREHLLYGIRDALTHIMDRSQRISVQLLDVLKERDDLVGFF